MKIAIASSGLGHIARGVETWARDTADALHARGLDVTLFCGAPVAQPDNAARRVTVPCIRRHSAFSKLIVRLMPGFAWRWGLKDGYGLEQLTFWLNLQRQLKLGGFDILHVQDPMLARWCRRARVAGRISTKEILAHGTEETPEFLDGFPYVQHLAPYHMAETLACLRAANEGERPPRQWVAIPNFVDNEVFRPVRDAAEKRALRASLGIPENVFVVLSVAAIKKTHKRVDYLIREFASFSASSAPMSTVALAKVDLRELSPHLVIAGARETETNDILELAGEMLGNRATLMCNLTRDQMPDVFRVADVFVLCSLKEMMPIALIEALSSGVPALVNAYPVLEWMIGPGGMALDMSGAGNLAEALGIFSRRAAENAETLGMVARQHAVQTFSKDAVIRKYIEYYERVLGDVECGKVESRNLDSRKQRLWNV